MALAAAPIIAAAIEAAPEVLSAMALVQQYGPSVKGSVNNLFHMGNAKKSAAGYAKNLATPKGLQKFFTKDIGVGLSHLGQTVGGVGGAARTIQGLTAGTTGVGAGVNKVAGLVGSAAGAASRYHSLIEKYHSQAKSLVSPLKAFRF